MNTHEGVPPIQILIVEDDPLSAKVLQGLLKRWGYVLLGPATTALEAIELCEQLCPDLILMDINMPGDMDGIEAASRILKNHAVPIIYMTAFTESELLDRAKITMPYGYMVKPFDAKLLEITISMALHKANAEKERQQTRIAFNELNKGYRTLLESMYLGELTLDRKGIITSVNLSAARILHVDSGKLLGQPVDKSPLQQFTSKEASPSLQEHPAMVALHTAKPHYDVIIDKSGDDATTQRVLASYLPLLKPDQSSPDELLIILKEIKPDTEKNTLNIPQESNRSELDYALAQDVLLRMNVKRPITFTNVHHFSKQMESVGGDVALASASRFKQTQYFFIGDSTGHGLHSALGILPIVDIFYNMSEMGHTVEAITREMNMQLYATLPTEMFMCATLIKIDYSKRCAWVVNCGLPSVFILGKQGIRHRVTSNALPIGAVESSSFDFSCEHIPLQPNDTLYILTDGVTEALDNTGNMLGQKGLEKMLVAAHSFTEQKTRFESIQDQLTTFQGSAQQIDDMTLMQISLPPSHIDPRYQSGSQPEQTPWSLSLTLVPETLRNTDFKSTIMSMLIQAYPSLEKHKTFIFLILSELYTNALDYGILHLTHSKALNMEAYFTTREARLASVSEGWMTIDLHVEFHNDTGELIIAVEDSGPGFSEEKREELLQDHTFSFGRGIQLVRSVCKSFRYENKGKRAVAVFEWNI